MSSNLQSPISLTVADLVALSDDLKHAISVRKAAEGYSRLGWHLVRVKKSGKNPVESGWPEKKLQPDVFTERDNIGIGLGTLSGGLVDVDLDSAEARALADAILPEPHGVFGRKSSPSSHRIYLVSDPLNARTIKFLAPKGDGRGEHAVLLELRAGGMGEGKGGGTGGRALQTLFPPSIHPSGEVVTWERLALDRPRIEARRVERACKILFLCSYALRKGIPTGNRHNILLYLSGAIAEIAEEGSEVTEAIEAVARAIGDEEIVSRVRDAAETWEKEAAWRAGGRLGQRPVAGLSRLVEECGWEKKDFNVLRYLPTPPPSPPPVVLGAPSTNGHVRSTLNYDYFILEASVEIRKRSRDPRRIGAPEEFLGLRVEPLLRLDLIGEERKTLWAARLREGGEIVLKPHNLMVKDLEAHTRAQNAEQKIKDFWATAAYFSINGRFGIVQNTENVFFAPINLDERALEIQEKLKLSNDELEFLTEQLIRSISDSFRVDVGLIEAIERKPSLSDRVFLFLKDHFPEVEFLFPLGLAIVSPFAAILRRERILVPHLSLYGGASLGKSTLAEVLCLGVGAEPRGADLATEYRMAAALETSGPVLVDEALNPENIKQKWVRELLKNSADSSIVRTIGTSSGRSIRFESRGVLFLTSNRPVFSDSLPELRRLIAITFSEEWAEWKKERFSGFHEERERIRKDERGWIWSILEAWLAMNGGEVPLQRIKEMIREEMKRIKSAGYDQMVAETFAPSFFGLRILEEVFENRSEEIRGLRERALVLLPAASEAMENRDLEKLLEIGAWFKETRKPTKRFNITAGEDRPVREGEDDYWFEPKEGYEIPGFDVVWITSTGLKVINDQLRREGDFPITSQWIVEVLLRAGVPKDLVTSKRSDRSEGWRGGRFLRVAGTKGVRVYPLPYAMKEAASSQTLLTEDPAGA